MNASQNSAREGLIRAANTPYDPPKGGMGARGFYSGGPAIVARVGDSGSSTGGTLDISVRMTLWDFGRTKPPMNPSSDYSSEIGEIPAPYIRVKQDFSFLVEGLDSSSDYCSVTVCWPVGFHKEVATNAFRPAWECYCVFDEIGGCTVSGADSYSEKMSKVTSSSLVEYPEWLVLTKFRIYRNTTSNLIVIYHESPEYTFVENGEVVWDTDLTGMRNYANYPYQQMATGSWDASAPVSLPTSNNNGVFFVDMLTGNPRVYATFTNSCLVEPAPGLASAQYVEIAYPFEGYVTYDVLNSTLVATDDLTTPPSGRPDSQPTIVCHITLDASGHLLEWRSPCNRDNYSESRHTLSPIVDIGVNFALETVQIRTRDLYDYGYVRYSELSDWTEVT